MKTTQSAEKMYCYDKVARPDSALYYSLRGLKKNQRDCVVAIHAFYHEIQDILLECENHELALIKLNWWRGEVDKLTNGQSDHPVLILLQKNAVDLLKVQQRLLKMIDGFEQNAISSHFETVEEVVVHWMRTAGERELLLLEQLQRDEMISPEVIYQLMLMVEIVNHVQHLRKFLRHDCLYFSMDELQQFHVTRAMLNEHVTTDSIKELLQDQFEKMQRAYEAVNQLSKRQRALLSHLLIRCHIARATMVEIQKSDFRVLEQLVTLTPLRYWWIGFYY